MNCTFFKMLQLSVIYHVCKLVIFLLLLRFYVNLLPGVSRASRSAIMSVILLYTPPIFKHCCVIIRIILCHNFVIHAYFYQFILLFPMVLQLITPWSTAYLGNSLTHSLKQETFDQIASTDKSTAPTL